MDLSLFGYSSLRNSSFSFWPTKLISKPYCYCLGGVIKKKKNIFMSYKEEGELKKKERELKPAHYVRHPK